MLLAVLTSCCTGGPEVRGGRLHLLSLATGRSILDVEAEGAQRNGAQLLAFSPNGTLLLCSDSGMLSFWDLAAAKPTPPLRHSLLPGLGRGVRFQRTAAVSLPPSIIGSADGEVCEIKLWDADTGRFIRVLGQQPGPVLSMAFRPDGHRLVTGAKMARVWDSETGGLCVALNDIDGPVAYSADGRHLVRMAGSPGVWDAESGGLR